MKSTQKNASFGPDGFLISFTKTLIMSHGNHGHQLLPLSMQNSDHQPMDIVHYNHMDAIHSKAMDYVHYKLMGNTHYKAMGNILITNQWDTYITN